MQARRVARGGFDSLRKGVHQKHLALDRCVHLQKLARVYIWSEAAQLWFEEQYC